MPATYLLDNRVINYLRGTAPTAISGMFLAALTAAPNLKTPTITEVSTSGTGYVRQSLALNTAINGGTANSSTISFPTATSDWGTITHVAIFDAVSGGNCLWVMPLTVSVLINTGGNFGFDTGSNIIVLTAN